MSTSKRKRSKTPPAPAVTTEEVMLAECILTSLECGGEVDDKELAIASKALRRSLGQTVMPGRKVELVLHGTAFYVHNNTPHRLRIEGEAFFHGKPTGYDLVISPHALDGKVKT
jgi:hypothetical protein